MTESLNKFKEKLKPGMKYIIPAAAFISLLVLVKVQGLTNVTADTGAQVTVVVDYLNETAKISAGPGGSNKFYVSVDKGKNWEGINVSSSNGVYAYQLDIGTLLSSKEVEVYFKGNKDTIPKVVKLMAEPEAPTITYTIVGGAGYISFATSGAAIEYRKGANGAWKPAVNNMSTTLYEIKGATLYYRTIATGTTRAGKIATVKIAKRPTAPSVKLDGSKLLLTGFKPGETEYRINDATEWTTFPTTDPKARTISLYSLLAPNAAPNTSLPAGMIEFRTRGSDKKVTSAPKMIEIPVQLTCPNVVILSGTTLLITDSTPKRMYEYTKLLPGTNYNPATAKWTSISPKKPTVLSKLAINDHILVRVKAATDSVTKQVIPASTYKEFKIESITPKK